MTTLSNTRGVGKKKRSWTGIAVVLRFVRDLRSRAMFPAMRRYCRGDVLDVGGRDFFLTAVEKGVRFDTWTTIEPSPEVVPDIEDPRFRFVAGDGCDMVEFEDASFDSAICLQVVEHVFEPNKMVSEISRVLRPGSHAIFLIPQTSMLHMAPDHYYNFTRYWAIEACKRAGLEIVSLQALGGFWSSAASRLVLFFPQSLGLSMMRVRGAKRSKLSFVLWPFMALYALGSIPVCLLLSIGDSPEEPNNHLVVARKPVEATDA